MAYHHHVNTHHRIQRAGRVKRTSIVVFTLVFLGGIVVGLDWARNNFFSKPSPLSVSSSSVRSASTNIFRTTYFQFQADKTWTEIASGVENPKVFTYRSLDKQLIQHELVIEIDPTTTPSLDNTQVTHVLPVTADNNLLADVSGISPHCSELLPDPKDKNQLMLTYLEASFPCNPDGSAFVVSIALVGKGVDIPYVSASDGISRTVRITYRDSTFSPSGRPLKSMINSFQLF